MEQREVCVDMKPSHCMRKGTDLNGGGLSREESLQIFKAVEAARDNAQSLKEINKTVLLDFPRIWQPKRIGALTTTVATTVSAFRSVIVHRFCALVSAKVCRR